MGLVKCPDCGHEISDAAPACVNCGRPIAAVTQPQKRAKCEVTLRQIHGLGVWPNAKWVLEAQVATPEGIRVIAACEYKSNNELAQFQGDKKGFQEAKRKITDELLRAGWEQAGGYGAGSSRLPWFERTVES